MQGVGVKDEAEEHSVGSDGEDVEEGSAGPVGVVEAGLSDFVLLITEQNFSRTDRAGPVVEGEEDGNGGV